MGIAAERVFKLSNCSGSLGLRCDERGLELAGVPLLKKVDRRFIPRPADEIEHLLTSVYGSEVYSDRVVKGLRAVACALNARDIGLAMTTAVLLKFPDPGWSGAARIAQADALLKYDPNEPRDWHGRWTTGGGGTTVEPKVQLLSSPMNNEVQNFLDAYTQRGLFGESWEAPESDPDFNPFPMPTDAVHLPETDRIDELGDLLESIANAKPSDAPGIANEIDRQFVQNGDLDGAKKLLGALLDITNKPQPTAADRQAILDEYEYLTHTDPRDAGQKTIDQVAQLAQMGLIPGSEPSEKPLTEEGAPPIDPNAPHEIWKKGWAARGQFFNTQLGSNLANNFPVIDKHLDDVITSIKSIDLNAVTYQSPTRFAWRLNNYVDKLASFQGMKWADEIVPNVKNRVLSLAVPKGSITAAQRSVIDSAKTRALTKNIQIIVTEF